MSSSNRKNERIQVTSSEIALLRILVMVHVASRLEGKEIEPFEAKLLEKLSRAYCRMAETKLPA